MAEVSTPNQSKWHMANGLQLVLQDRVRPCERIQREVGTCTRRTVRMKDSRSLGTLWKWDGPSLQV
jgi:hypothetical protein